MLKQFKYRNLAIVLFFDVILFVASFYISHLIRFDFDISIQRMDLFKQVIVPIVCAKIVVFKIFNLYRGMWRYTSILDLINILKASTISTLVAVFGVFIATRFVGFSRSVFIIDWCFTILFVAGLRLCVRIYYEHNAEDETWALKFHKLRNVVTRKISNTKRLLVVGAGDSAEKMYREIRDNAALRYNVVGFLDDHPVKIGKLIHGIPVLGKIRDIKELSLKVEADELLIAISSATSREMRAIVDYCEASGLPYKTIPGIGELIDGRVTVNSIRDVAYRDLLGREDIKLDEEKIGEYIEGKVVMVTGAGGSIGSELSRQICRFAPQQILLFERAESPLYEIEIELKRYFQDIDVVPVLADIQYISQIERVFDLYGPSIVFHAAAYKHVPMLEHQAWKAVKNNIIGTANVAECATKYNIDRFVLVSTDKAVRPTNVMGASKRIAEILIQNQADFNKCDTKFMIVRFGNVVGSAGSVLPLFKKQIEKGGPVTVTDPEITRYFMTIPEASQLILQAGSMGTGGEIFILDMGTPIKIDNIARDLIRLSGLEPDEDIKIKYIGLRPGEKLYEELITEGEGIVPTEHKKIMVLRGAGHDLQVLNGNIEKLAGYSENYDGVKIVEKLKKILPEYKPAVHSFENDKTA